MYLRRRKKMRHLLLTTIVLLSCSYALGKSVTSDNNVNDNNLDNNIIDLDEDLSVKYNKDPWSKDEYFNKETHRYTIDNDLDNIGKVGDSNKNDTEVNLQTSTVDFSVIPLELTSTTEKNAVSNVESTTEQDLSVIPLRRIPPTTLIQVTNKQLKETTIIPTTTENIDTTTYYNDETTFTTLIDEDNTVTEMFINDESSESTKSSTIETTTVILDTTDTSNITDMPQNVTKRNKEIEEPSDDGIENLNYAKTEVSSVNSTVEVQNSTLKPVDKIEIKSSNVTTKINISREDISSEFEDTDVPIFTELDTEEDIQVPEDYYDAKDVVPTTAPKTDALSLIFGLAGSVVESVVETVAEKVVPKGIVDLFRRMQRQSEALEAEKLRSREENGGIGQFGRGILKTISTGISVPLSQLMAGVRDIGSLDNDRSFVSSVANSVTSVAKQATEVVDAFKDKVHAIYPGTVWCGDGRSATARSQDLGLFFFTDTCCRQHDACKIYIRAGETKYGLTNTGLFTRSHCSCDAMFRDCLRRTNSLVSAQIGLTYFNVLGPQCFRKAHPIVKCVKKTRITGLKCEEYELDYSKPKMWQWFDNETF